VAETNQLLGRGLVLVPGCDVHILGNWLMDNGGGITLAVLQ